MTEIRHGYGLRQRPWSEGLNILGSHERDSPEGRSPATRGEQTLQRRDLRVQFPGAAQSLCLSVFAVTLSGSPLVGPRFLFVLSPTAGFGFQLPLLLPLHLGPDADGTSRATTHVLQALPRTGAAERCFGCPRNQL
ncbi:hypothetical protein ACKI1I_32770 [Streptomyces turgidiscabies]|uniref:hypothetical protein n=1 Tax=Streptomyces TaxID=1883 RepID=UPI001F35FC28|nr:MULTISPECIES: hypothetical protein [Streptomyces]MDX3498407.1 hypothetical protein [Streptomyces turgidiscabies]